MIKIINESEYEQYTKKLKEAIERQNVQGFMNQNKFLGIDFNQKFQTVPNYTLSMPYYDEIPIERVVAWNSPDSTILANNWKRVVDAVAYILKDECMPIAVIKLSNNEYYIENGKHRFYAHLLLQKKKIPVSVRYAIEKSDSKENMLNYNIPFYNCDGMEIAYPEKVVEFIDRYVKVENQMDLLEQMIVKIKESMEKFRTSVSMDIGDDIKKQLYQQEKDLEDLDDTMKCLYKDFSYVNLNIKSVEMKNVNDRYILHIEMRNNRNIIINGCLSSGNSTRASRCTCEILNKLGFQVDMEYIVRKSAFKLYDKRDAHNINFDIKTDDDTIRNLILLNINKKQVWNVNEDLKKDFHKLMTYIHRYPNFKTPGTHFSWYSSSFIQIESNNYYLVGAEDKDSSDSIYIFKSREVPFNNLTITYLGRVKSGTELYKKLLV